MLTFAASGGPKTNPYPTACSRRPEGIAALWLSPLSFNRRLNRDCELLSETSETLIYAAMIRLMVRRLAS